MKRSSRISKLTFKNDPLLKNGNIVENNGIKIINIYNVIVDRKDFNNNKKGKILKRCPYIYDPKEYLKSLINELPKEINLLSLRQLLADYLGTKQVRNDTFSRWLKNDIYPLPLVRIICNLTERDFFKIIEENHITDYCGLSNIKLPSKLGVVTSPFMAYFIGLHLGDGTLNKERWKITDGYEKLEDSKYSIDFLSKIRNCLESIFSISIREPYKMKNKNAYELAITNKWFCRFLNSFYHIKFGEKDSRISNITSFATNDKRLKSEIIRGFFDSDGSAEEYRALFASSTKSFINYVKLFLRENEITYSTRILERKEGKSLYIIGVLGVDLDKFGKMIGFTHPKKLGILINSLRKPSLESRLIGLKEENLKQGYFDIDKISIYFNNKCKSIRFPDKPTKEIMYLAKHVRIVKNHRKIRIVAARSKINTDRIRKILYNNFGVELSGGSYVFSRYLELFFDAFFKYEHLRKGMTYFQTQEIKRTLENKWVINQ